MDELEEECQDAVFEVCDARERYPSLCANELARCLKLESEISSTPVNAPPILEINVPTMSIDQANFLENFGIRMKNKAAWTEREKKIHTLANKMEDLRVVAEQIEREKQCDINRILKD